MFKSAIIEVELDDGGKHEKKNRRGRLKTHHKEQSSWTKQSSEAATDVLEKRYSYKQLFWKLPGQIFSQNPWKISLKKFVFCKVVQSHSRKILPKKETGEKHNFHKFPY